jgi:hypothetical protein
MFCLDILSEHGFLTPDRSVFEVSRDRVITPSFTGIKFQFRSTTGQVLSVKEH